MRKRMEEMEREMKAFVDYVRKEFMNRTPEAESSVQNALVRVGPPSLSRAGRRPY